VSIIGAGAGTTVIDANGMGGVLRFQSEFGSLYTGLVTDVTLTGGNLPSDFAGAGATVINYGSLTLRRVVVRNNVSEFVGGGLFILANDFMVVENSTISGNSAVSAGGGIWNQGGLTLTNVTISGNSADEGAGVLTQAAQART
jgi:hypothetical protein